MGLEQIPGWEKLTEEQKAKLVALRSDTLKKRVPVLIFKILGITILTNLVLVAISALLNVNSIGFLAISGFITGFFFMPAFFRPLLTKERDRIESEVKKIINP